MGTVSVSLPTDGTTADVGDYNTPITTIVNAINGGLDNANIASGAAIATSKIASDGGLSSAAAGSGFVVQTVGTSFSAVVTGTTTIPYDDTIPQITEGTEFMTQAITPKSATNKLVITATFFGTINAITNLVIALFQDATTNGIAANAVTVPTASYLQILTITYSMTAGTISSTTFRIRVGGSGAGTVTMNGDTSLRRFGGVAASSLMITEYRP